MLLLREESLLFKRERGNGVYGASAYFLSVLLFDLIPLRVLPPMFFSIISYWLMDLHSGCALCILWFTLVAPFFSYASWSQKCRL